MDGCLNIIRKIVEGVMATVAALGLLCSALALFALSMGVLQVDKEGTAPSGAPRAAMATRTPTPTPTALPPVVVHADNNQGNVVVQVGGQGNEAGQGQDKSTKIEQAAPVAPPTAVPPPTASAPKKPVSPPIASVSSEGAQGSLPFCGVLCLCGIGLLIVLAALLSSAGIRHFIRYELFN